VVDGAHWRRGALALTLAASLGAAHAADGASEWTFRAYLDGRPIGQHRFSLGGQGLVREALSDADFAVRILGVTAYRYRHTATEQWRGDCLAALVSTTDDDGKRSSVRGEREGDVFAVRAGSVTESIPGCVMSFAYWNPAIRSQTRLLNAQTGQLESVQVQPVGGGSIEVRGKPVAAAGFRITGPANPIVVWYSEQGEWIGLDSTVAGGRRLSYRLQ
jgi:hypothetical protein